MTARAHRRRVAVVALAWQAIACSSTPPGPAAVDTRNDSCSQCRMAVSDLRFVSQIVTPREEPRFFDDIGCLRDYLATHRDLPRGSRLFVADSATRVWIPAADAWYRRDSRIETPMGSHLVAFATLAAAQAASADGPIERAIDVFGAEGPPVGAQ